MNKIVVATASCEFLLKGYLLFLLHFSLKGELLSFHRVMCYTLCHLCTCLLLCVVTPVTLAA